MAPSPPFHLYIAPPLPPRAPSHMAQDEMVAYVKTTGPLSVCVDASEWSTYQSGVIAYCDQDLNHCVQVTPYLGPYLGPV